MSKTQVKYFMLGVAIAMVALAFWGGLHYHDLKEGSTKNIAPAPVITETHMQTIPALPAGASLRVTAIITMDANGTPYWEYEYHTERNGTVHQKRTGGRVSPISGCGTLLYILAKGDTLLTFNVAGGPEITRDTSGPSLPECGKILFDTALPWARQALDISQSGRAN